MTITYDPRNFAGRPLAAPGVHLVRFTRPEERAEAYRVAVWGVRPPVRVAVEARQDDGPLFTGFVAAISRIDEIEQELAAEARKTPSAACFEALGARSGHG